MYLRIGFIEVRLGSERLLKFAVAGRKVRDEVHFQLRAELARDGDKGHIDGALHQVFISNRVVAELAGRIYFDLYIAVRLLVDLLNNAFKSGVAGMLRIAVRRKAIGPRLRRGCKTTNADRNH